MTRARARVDEGEGEGRSQGRGPAGAGAKHLAAVAGQVAVGVARCDVEEGGLADVRARGARAVNDALCRRRALRPQKLGSAARALGVRSCRQSGEGVVVVKEKEVVVVAEEVEAVVVVEEVEEVRMVVVVVEEVVVMEEEVEEEVEEEEAPLGSSSACTSTKTSCMSSSATRIDLLGGSSVPAASMMPVATCALEKAFSPLSSPIVSSYRCKEITASHLSRWLPSPTLISSVWSRTRTLTLMAKAPQRSLCNAARRLARQSTPVTTLEVWLLGV